MKTEGTLKELNVKPGDVVRWHGQDQYNDMTVFSARVIPKGESFSGQVQAELDGYGCGVFDEELFMLISRATDTPTLWRDMTPEEKGAFLLAHHEGDVVQVWSGGDWADLTKYDSFYEVNAYRIKPEPKVEVVTSMWAYEKGGKDGFCHPSNRNATHRITFNTIDGDIPHGTYTNECGHTITVDKL